MKKLYKILSIVIASTLVFSAMSVPSQYNKIVYADQTADTQEQLQQLDNCVTVSQSLNESFFNKNNNNTILTSTNNSYSEFQYLDQLTADQKGIYNQFVNNTRSVQLTSFTYNFTQGVSAVVATKTITDEVLSEFSKYTQNTLGYALQAFINDYPTVFWLNRNIEFSYSYVFTEIDGGFLVTLKSIDVPITIRSEYGTLENTVKLQSQYDKFLSSFTLSTTSRYEQVKEIQKKICSQVSYDADGIYSNSSAGVFLPPYQAVCEGYATAFKVLCDKYNIPCVIVSGSSIKDTNNTGHMWCYVQMENLKWYAVDPTWDDDDTAQTVNFNYLLKGSAFFNTEHISTQTPSGIVLQTPTLEQTDYDPTQKWIPINSFDNIPTATISVGADETLENIYKILGTTYKINDTDQTVSVAWQCSYFNGQPGRYIFFAIPTTTGYYVSNDCNDTVAVNVMANYTSLPLDFTSSTTDASGNGYSWNATSKTLTLKGFRQISYFSSGIRLPANSTIISESSIDFTDNIVQCINNAKASIYCSGDLNIKGSALLKAGGSSKYGIYAKGNITFNGSVSGISDKEFGIYTEGNINMTNSSCVNIQNVTNGVNCIDLSLSTSFLNASAINASILNTGTISAKSSNLLCYSTNNIYPTIPNQNISNTLLVNKGVAQLYGDTVYILAPTTINIGTDYIPINLTINPTQTLVIGSKSIVNLNGNITNSGRIINTGQLNNNGQFSNLHKFINAGILINKDSTSFITADTTIDCNGDGLLTVADMVLLRKYIIDPTSVPYQISKIDINGDGRLSIIDLLMLAFEMIAKI